MTIVVKHKKVSGLPDNDRPAEVQPSEWNDTHDVVLSNALALLDTLVAAPDKGIYFVDANNVATFALSEFMRGVLGSATKAALSAATDLLLKTGDTMTGSLTLSGDPTLALHAATKGYVDGLVTGAVIYKGTWNALTNTPAIPAAGPTNNGNYYRVSTDGTTSIDGINDWKAGDWIISNGTVWQKIDNTDAVTTVAGRVGAVTLTAADIGAGTFPAGTFNWTSSTINVTTQAASDSSTKAASTAHVHAVADPLKAGGMSFVIDGGGATITTGIKGDIVIPFACTITGWTLLGDQSGSIVVDIWKDTYANFPPVVGDTITAAAKPTISAATKGQSSTLTGWTTSVAAGDVLRFNVDSVTSIQRATLALNLLRP